MSRAPMRSMTLAVVAALAGIAAGAAKAADPGDRQTREFIQAAGESDTFEIMEAHTALAQSRDPEVIAFAKQMIQDHGETSRRLSEVAIRAGLKPPPMAVGASQSPFLAALQSARGADFDRLYWQQQALAHRSALVTEQAYAAAGGVPAIRQTAAATIPMIQSHLAMAERMRLASKPGG
jgi:putative membrane protein